MRPTDSFPFTGHQDENSIEITVFTATYNRAHTLHRAYNSLASQTYKGFEWLVVDDGSSDGTRELIAGWQQVSSFSIRYIYQPNQGKHVAFNLAVTQAKGWLFASLDSDDALLPDTLERAFNCVRQIHEGEIGKYAGVEGLCIDQRGDLIGDGFPSDEMDADYLQIRYAHKVTGDKWGLMRTEVLRQYPIPTVKDAKYVPEGFMWSRIARRFKTRYVNQQFSIVYVDESPRSDRLSMEPNPAKHANAMSHWHQSLLNENIDWLPYWPMHFLRSAVHFSRFSFHSRKSVRSQLVALNHWKQRLLWLIGLPVGLAAYLRDRQRFKGRRQGASSSSRALPSNAVGGEHAPQDVDL